MIEEQAYYQPKALHIIQNARGVWLLHSRSYTTVARWRNNGTPADDTYPAYLGALIGPNGDGGEDISVVTGVTGAECAGREMVLVPADENDPTPPSMAQTLLRAYRRAAFGYHAWYQAHSDESPRSADLAQLFEDQMRRAMDADPAMNPVDRQEMRHYPRVVCLCGSTRFSDAFHEANLCETLAGRIVLSIGCNFKSDDALGLTDEDKGRLDELHLRKIDLADEVLILNQGGYVGQSTARELLYARQRGKQIRWLEPDKALLSE